MFCRTRLKKDMLRLKIEYSWTHSFKIETSAYCKTRKSLNLREAPDKVPVFQLTYDNKAPVLFYLKFYLESLNQEKTNNFFYFGMKVI